MPHVARDFKAEPASVKAARDFVIAALRVWDMDELEEFATLLTSELVTNAVIHARTAFRLHASCAPSELIVEIRDRSPEFAPGPPHGRDAAYGRGLALVAAVAARWGVRFEEYGKTVWFSLAPSGGPVVPLPV
jgi:anti-sigma regulatory factor (Ser/Thr protein kinase)